MVVNVMGSWREGVGEILLQRVCMCVCLCVCVCQALAKHVSFIQGKASTTTTITTSTTITTPIITSVNYHSSVF